MPGRADLTGPATKPYASSPLRAEELPLPVRFIAILICYAAVSTAVQAADVLLLNNGELLTGHSRREGEFLVVELPRNDNLAADAQGQFRIPVARVAYQADSKQAVFAHLRSKLGQPQSGWSRLTLAEWAIQQRLLPQAAELLAELQAAGAHPDEVARVSERLRHATAQPVSPTTAPTQVASWRTPVEVGDLLEPATMVEFCGFVQPLLLNSCARCHGPAHDSAFTLRRPRSGQRASRRLTHDNLVAVLGAMEQGQLLDYCQRAHGTADTPTRHQQPAPCESWRKGQLQRLAHWVRSVAQTTSAAETNEGDAAADTPAVDPFDPTPFNQPLAEGG